MHLQIGKAHRHLGWQPRRDFATSVARTIACYRTVHGDVSPLACCMADLEAYHAEVVDAH